MRHRGNEWRKDNLQQIVMQQVNIHTQKMEFDESHTIYKKKKNSKLIIDVNLKPKTTQPLNLQNTGDFYDLELGKVFLGMTSKA